MTTGTCSDLYNTYLRLVAEYQQSVARCDDALEDLKLTQQDLHNVAKELEFDTRRLKKSDALQRKFAALFGNPDNSLASKVGKLSRREREVFEMLGEGLASTEIAAKLNVANSTVETYRERLKDKLNLPHGAALTRYAIVWAMLGS